MKPLKLIFGLGKKKSENEEVLKQDDNPLIDKSIVKSEKKKKIKPALDMSKAERYSPEYSEGLNETQLNERRDNGYINVIAKKNGRSYGRIIVDNVFTFFNILTFAVAIALIYAGAQPTQLFFLIIILANILIGIIQEVRSKRTIDKLSLITAPTAQVIRGGTQTAVPTNELVLDDIVKLETGHQICSDCILLVGECEVNESVITGESVAVQKRAGDILYSGSYISSGSCYARVDKVGADNYIETLTSNAKRYKKPRSELKNSITFLIKIVTVFIIPISLLMIIVGLTSGDGGAITTDDIKETINTTSGAIIGMIPAGMFLLTSMALAIGVIRLAKRHALVQDLYCIEMLARVDVLCLDKTGTLTDGTMRVKEYIPLAEDGKYHINDVVASMLAATGDNNQTAIALGQEFTSTAKYRPVTAMPFSSQRKLSAVTFEEYGTFALGAPEFVIKTKNPVLEALVNEKAAEGLRMVVIAHSDTPLGATVPSDMKPLFLVAIEDHIREDAIDLSLIHI